VLRDIRYLPDMVCGHYVVTLFLNWTPIFEWCMAQLVVNMGTNKTHIIIILEYIFKM
jgi:hypothetical protein